MKRDIVCFMLLLGGQVCAQGIESITSIRTPWEVLTGLSARGLAPSVVMPDGFATDANPALGTGNASLVLGVSLQYHVETDLVSVHNESDSFVPLSCGMKYRYRAISLGVTYNRTMFRQFDMVLPLVTPNDPLGDSRVHYFEEAGAHAIAFDLAWSLPLPTRTSLGVQYEMSGADYERSMTEDGGSLYDGSGSATASRWRMGLLSTRNLRNGDELTVGCFYSTTLDLVGDIRYTAGAGAYLRGFDVSSPASLDAGVQVSHGKHVYAFEIAKPFSSGLRSAEADRFQYSGSLRVDASTRWSYMAGFRTSFIQSEPESESQQKYLDAVYLVAGIARLGITHRIDLVVADSHLTNYDWHRRTIVKLGISLYR